MEQSRKLETSDTTTVRVDVPMDEQGNAVVGHDLPMDFSDLGAIDATDGSGNLPYHIFLLFAVGGSSSYPQNYHGPPSPGTAGATRTPAPKGAAVLDLPSLEGGRKANEVITKYLEGMNLRVSKLSEIKAKIENIPAGERSENINKFSPQFVSCLFTVMELHECAMGELNQH